jgi:hypothetical protein
MRSSLLVATTIVALAVVVYRNLLLIRGPRTPARWCVTLATWSIAVGMGFGIPSAYTWLDELVGVPNLARLVRHASAMTCIFALQLMYVYLDESKPARRAVVSRVVLWSVAVTALSVLFALAPVDVEEPENFTDVYATAPWIPQYMIVYLGYLAVGTVDQIARARRYARRAQGRVLVRTVGNMYAAGLGIAAVYIAFKASVIAAAQLGVRLPVSQTSVTTVLLFAAVCTVSYGTLSPVVKPWLTSTQRLPGRFRVYRRLHPLWLACYRASSHIALDPPADPARNPWLPPRQLEAALYRRVIEILDGIRALRPYLDPAVGAAAAARGAAAGLDGEQLAALAPAAELAVAFAAVEADAPPQELPAGGPSTAESLAQQATGGTRPVAQRLAAVADMLQHSPIVAALRVEHDPATRTAPTP